MSADRRSAKRRLREWKGIRNRPVLAFSKPQTFFLMAYDGGPRLRVESWQVHSFDEARTRARLITGMEYIELFWTSQDNAMEALLDSAHLRGVPIAL